MEMFNIIGSWFGYVGACVATPDATCRPLLAFVALGTAAGIALALLLIAYGNAQRREAAALESRRADSRNDEAQERVRRAIAERAAVKPVLTGRLTPAA